MVVGSCLATACAGLISTFDPQSSLGVWIGYQALAGVAFGLSFQAPIMAAQALAAHEDVATTTAVLYCKTSTLLQHTSNLDHALTLHSLPTPRSRNLRLHRRIDLQQHPDRQSAVESPWRRYLRGHSRGCQSSRSVSSRGAGKNCAVLYGWLESCVPDGGGSGWLCVLGQPFRTLGQYQGEGLDGCSMISR
jgi:hypothetical protein